MRKIRFFNSKKALSSFQALTGVIIFVLLMVIIIMFMYKVHISNQQQAYDARCRASLMAYSRLISMPQIPFHEGAAAKETDLDCPIKYVTIPKTSKKNKQRKVIADLMFQCWHNYGEGKVRLFRANSKKFCSVCSIMQFENKKDVLEGMPYYLMTQKVPIKKDNSYPSYYEFVTGNKPTQEILAGIQKQDLGSLVGSQKYAIFFTYYEESSWAATKRFLVGAIIGAAVVTVAVGITVITGGVGAVAAVGIVVKGATVAAIIMGTTGAATATGPHPINANLVFLPYETKYIKELGCTEIPVSTVDKKFR